MSATVENVVTPSGTFQFYRTSDYGCLVDQAQMAKYIWISEERYQRDRTDLADDILMWLAYHEAKGAFQFEVEMSAVLSMAAKRGALEFIPQAPPINGYVLSLNAGKFREHLSQEKC